MSFKPSLAVLAAMLCLAGSPAEAKPHSVTIGIAAINDFHGALEPPHQSVAVPDGKGGTAQVPAGGAAWLASAIDSIRAKYRYHLTVAAGDLISASQISSSLFMDEPAIGVANRLGVEFSAPGNHEFDAGRRELLRKQYGGCAQFTQRQPCQLERFTGAKFHYLAANVLTEGGAPLFPATAIRSFGKGRNRVRIGLIGLTLKGTSNLVNAAGTRGLSFADEADTINALVPKLKRQGADAIAVLIHEGARTPVGSDPNGCDQLVGGIRPILDRLDTRVDLVVSGHTHWAYVCDYGKLNPAKPFLLTSAGVYGQLVSDITLKIDPRRHRVTAKLAHNVVVQSEPYVGSRGPVGNSAVVPIFQPRGDVRDYVARYVDAARKVSQRPIGKLSGGAEKNDNGSVNQGGPLGNLVADAALAATKDAGAQIAFMNPNGIRAALVPAPSGPNAGNVTFGMIYDVLPFHDDLITQTMTGTELKAVLEQAIHAGAPDQFLSPSAGFHYVFDRKASAGQRVVAMSLNGQPINPQASYRVTTDSFLANGGDGFSLFTKLRDQVVGPVDLDSFEAWLKAESVRQVPQEVRVTEPN